MVQEHWVVVAVRYPQDIWETGGEEFCVRLCERGGSLRPEEKQYPYVIATTISPHAGASVAEAAIRAIEAVQADAAEAGIGLPTAIDVHTLDAEPGGPKVKYQRRAAS